MSLGDAAARRRDLQRETRAPCLPILRLIVGNDPVCRTKARFAADAATVVSTRTGVVQILDGTRHVETVVPVPGSA